MSEPTMPIRFGCDLPTDDELKLCSSLRDGQRALELGVSHHRNAIAFADKGAKALAIDTNPDRIDALRTAATEHEVMVECHHGELADLGFATSGSLDLVIADHTLGEVDDRARVFRQAHRTLKSSRPFVIATPHPFGEIASADGNLMPYGSTGWTVSEWLTYLGRANFKVDKMLELGVTDDQPLPHTLIIRAVKEGD